VSDIPVSEDDGGWGGPRQDNPARITVDGAGIPDRPAERAPDESSTVYDWTPTRALRRAIGLACLLLLAGIALHRVDLVLLGMPFALGTAWALRRRPRALPAVELEVATDVLAEGTGLAARVTVGNPDRRPLDLITLRLARSGWLRLYDGGDRYALPVGMDGAEHVVGGLALRWGRRQVGPLRARAFACEYLLASRWLRADARELRIYPITHPFDAVDAMPRASGIAGSHRSRRPGEGGELAGVRPFAPGDRLRRVDWRVSLRNRELYVNAMLSERDTDVVLVLDVLHEATALDPARPSVLDTTVRAAAGIGEHYLTRGDRVSAVEFGPRMRHLRAATGHRQYLSMLEWLLDVRVVPAGVAPESRLLGPRVLPPSALVVFLTPMLDDRTSAMLATLARTNRFVLAVDTLPPDVRPPVTGDWTDLAYRLWQLDRRNTVGQLREVGVPVVAWAGPGSLDEVLRDVTRMASAPKALLR
jgi:uncharacterized protein (DUF58 family)